jgi:predicted DNA-binding transcriptional regulator
MVSKDQTIGGVIFILCLIVAIFYVLTLFYPTWVVNLGWARTEARVQFWIVAIPVFVAFIAIMGIGAWIGWTMATTPPPKPIEEITSELEEKKEEEKPEEKMPEEPSPPPSPEPEEEKKPERRRKA